MKYEVRITDENGRSHNLNLETSSSMDKNNLNDFILQALRVSEDKRKLPFIIQSPNGVEVYPSIKMKFEGYGSPILDDKIEAMVVTWQD